MPLSRKSWSKNKYHVAPKPERTYNGKVYASKFEMLYAMQLDRRLEAGDIAGWSGQPRFQFVINGVKIGEYRADFAIAHHDGSTEYIETKGFETPEFKLKMKLMEALHPDITIRLVKRTER